MSKVLQWEQKTKQGKIPLIPGVEFVGGGDIVKVLMGEWEQLRCKFIGSFSTPPHGCYLSSYLSKH